MHVISIKKKNHHLEATYYHYLMKVTNLIQKYWVYSLGLALFDVLGNDLRIKIKDTLIHFLEDTKSVGRVFLEEEDLNVLWEEMHDLEDPRNRTGLKVTVQKAHRTNSKNSWYILGAH